MYAYIKGSLVYSSPIYVVVEAGGIGYKIYIPASVFAKLPQIEDEVLLQTSFVIRENFQGLYGFLTIQERELFEALQNVSGIGPKLALSLIGHMSLQDLHLAISNHNVTQLSKVPGVGKKIAERLIIEMRDKLESLFPHDLSEFAISLPPADPKTQKINDAMSALINLGYNQMTAQKALKKTLNELPENVDLGTLITNALKNV